MTLIRYSEITKSVDYSIDVLFDNAKTRTKASSDLKMIGKSSCTPCLMINCNESINCNERNGEEKEIDRFDNEEKSKGLLLL